MRKGWIWTAAIVATVGIGAGTAGGYALRGGEDTLPAGLTVGGLPVGGRSSQEALTAIRERIRLLEDTRVSPAVSLAAIGGQSDGGAKKANLSGSAESEAIAARAPSAVATLTLRQLGLTLEAGEAIEAIEAFKEAKWWQRGSLRKKLKPSYDFVAAWDEEKLNRESDEAWAGLASSPSRDASRDINARDEIVYTREVLGTAADMDALRSEVHGLTPTSLLPAAEGASAPLGSSVAVDLPVKQTVPKVTVDSLKDEGLSRKIVEFSTSFATSGEGRSHNVAVTAQALDGTLLQPGDEFDYGAIVAKAEKEYGYKEAPVILNGKLTPGIGGGICQVSSTLYNAIIRVSGIDIVERRNHSLPVHYLPAGLDATFADGYINFRFRNSTGKQLLVKTEVKDKTLTVKLFGTMDEKVSYEIETVQKKVIAPKTVYVADDKLKLGSARTLQQGEAGYVIESYRAKYVNGQFAERKKLATSTYKSQNETVAVNGADPRVAPSGGGKPSPGAGDGGPAEPV